jgi:hypothetical protein
MINSGDEDGRRMRLAMKMVMKMVRRMVRRRMKDMCCCWRWVTVEERLEKDGSRRVLCLDEERALEIVRSSGTFAHRQKNPATFPIQ